MQQVYLTEKNTNALAVTDVKNQKIWNFIKKCRVLKGYLEYNWEKDVDIVFEHPGGQTSCFMLSS